MELNKTHNKLNLKSENNSKLPFKVKSSNSWKIRPTLKTFMMQFFSPNWDKVNSLSMDI